MTTFVIFAYLALVLIVGALSHRLCRGTGEDYFVASSLKDEMRPVWSCRTGIQHYNAPIILSFSKLVESKRRGKLHNLLETSE